MNIIIGLGNPGKKYEKTRHNMGFQAIDILAQRMGISVDKLKFKALTGEGRIGSQKVILAKPQTYMNLSGFSVREIAAFYKVEPEEITVIYDDIDIPLGTVRIRKKGSAGTHNGMRSVVEQLGVTDFPRIRVGIGEPEAGADGHRKVDLADFVTGSMSKLETELTGEALKRAAEAAEAIVLRGIEKAMNEYNIRPKKEKKERRQKEEPEQAAEGEGLKAEESKTEAAKAETAKIEAAGGEAEARKEAEKND